MKLLKKLVSVLPISLALVLVDLAIAQESQRCGNLIIQGSGFTVVCKEDGVVEEELIAPSAPEQDDDDVSSPLGDFVKDEGDGVQGSSTGTSLKIVIDGRPYFIKKPPSPESGNIIVDSSGNKIDRSTFDDRLCITDGKSQSFVLASMVSFIAGGDCDFFFDNFIEGTNRIDYIMLDEIFQDGNLDGINALAVPRFYILSISASFFVNPDRSPNKDRIEQLQRVLKIIDLNYFEIDEINRFPQITCDLLMPDDGQSRAECDELQ